MKTFLPPRLRRPALAALAGTAFAVAWLVRGGPSWFLSIVIEVTILVWAVSMYIQAGREIKDGTRTAAGRDERQQVVSMRSRALAGSVVTVAAFIGLTVAVAMRATWWWPCAAIVGLAVFSYLYGLSRFGVGEEGQGEDDDADSGYEARSPVTS